MASGYWGKILKVDLPNRRITVDEPDDNFYRRYLGGAGVSAYYLLHEMPAGVEAFSPENVLVLAPGVLTGQPLGGTGRIGVGAKSPLTGGVVKSEVGGHWGAELKKAGFDGVVITGQAEQPVYLWIHDGQAEIRDAHDLWGRDTKETQEALRRELGDRLARIAQIGPGGENLVRFACVMVDLKDAAGRGGGGAVMGAKNLKAIAVRGSRVPPVADPDKVRELSKWLAANYLKLAQSFHEFGTGPALQLSTAVGNLPTRNFRDGFFAEAQAIGADTLRDTIRVGMESCYACPVRCKKVVQVGAPYDVDPAYGGPEYETLASFGSNCGISDLKAVCKANMLCNAYSLDTISTGATVAFAMECFENGLLTREDTDGLELRFGNVEAMLRMVEMIARRQGLGDLLAEGSRRAAQRLGLEAGEYSIQVKGLEAGMHEPRLKRGLGLGFAVAAVGADHCAGLHDTVLERAVPAGLRALGFLDPLPSKDLGYRKVAVFAASHQVATLRDALIVCSFVPWSHDQLVDMTRAVTGWNTSFWELMKAGERVVTMDRAFNLREGLTAADDALPARFFAPTTGGALKNSPMDRADLENAKRAYYRLMGWDAETGVPTPEKLADLGIEWVGQTSPRLS